MDSLFLFPVFCTGSDHWIKIDLGIRLVLGGSFKDQQTFCRSSMRYAL